MNNRKHLLMKLDAASFALLEMQLYLDSHPTDRTALSLYRHYAKAYGEAKELYEREVGPTGPMSAAKDTWTWVETPWPWDNEAN